MINNEFSENSIEKPQWEGIEKFPKDLAPYAIQQEQLEALRELFENEPSAEELCKMLTK